MEEEEEEEEERKQGGAGPAGSMGKEGPAGAVKSIKGPAEGSVRVGFVLGKRQTGSWSHCLLEDGTVRA